MRDSCGISGPGETPEVPAPRRLTARSAKSGHPAAEIGFNMNIIKLEIKGGKEDESENYTGMHGNRGPELHYNEKQTNKPGPY